MGKKKKRKKQKPEPWVVPDPGAASDDVRTIAIDIEIHRLIEASRKTFDETESDILRRLLGFDGAVAAPAAPPALPTPPLPASGRRAKGGGAADGGWSKIGRHGRTVLLPDGTRVRAAYDGHTIEGEIAGGKWSVGGRTFNSPSAALNAFARTRDGKTVNLNGWRHWEALVPGADIWARIGEM